MPYIDPEGVIPGWSADPQPGLGYTKFVQDVPTPAPLSVSAAQGGIALIQAGLMDKVQTALDAPDTPPEMVWAFQKAQFWDRSSPSLSYLANKAGISDSEMNDLFAAAAAIAV